MGTKVIGKAKILFVEDQPRFREAIITELKGFGIQTIAEASNGEECLTQLESISPDVILLDLDMPVMNGNITFNMLKERYPKVRVIILSQHDDPGMVENYIHRGVHGYVPKQFVSSNVDVLAEGIFKVMRSESFFYSYDPENPLKYTKRETEIIPMICEGKISKEIGSELGIDEKQVRKLRTQLHKKTRTRNAAEFIKPLIQSIVIELKDRVLPSRCLFK